MTGGDPEGGLDYRVYYPGLAERVGRIIGWTMGWGCYWTARCGLPAIAEKFVDTSIALRRGNSGAVRTIGCLNGKAGRLALRRGKFLIDGQVGPHGPFAGKRFVAGYVVAARDESRALHLIRRFESDALITSLSLEKVDWWGSYAGAEGVLEAPENRFFYVDE